MKKIFNFTGGLKLPEGIYPSKITQLACPTRLYIPLVNKYGSVAAPAVKVNDYVLANAPLTQASTNAISVHAPVCGTIEDIIEHPYINSSTQPAPTIVLKTNPSDKNIHCEIDLQNYSQFSADFLCQQIHQAGIVGLGGAGFFTSYKLQQKIDTLIINASECEPPISTDNALMVNYAAQIIAALDVLQYIVLPKKIIIAIEEDKKAAIAAIQQQLTAKHYSLQIIPRVYPSGSSKHLIKILTNQNIAANQHAIHYGIVCLNVATVYAIYQRIFLKQNLTSRIITIADLINNKFYNCEVKIGTSLTHIMQQLNIPHQHTLITQGGFLMHDIVATANTGVVKTSNCLIFKEDSRAVPQECIRCSKCSNICPQQLLPQKLYWHSKDSNVDKLKKYHLKDCITCGACDYVCPSQIPLSHIFKKAQHTLRAQKQSEQQAQILQERFAQHNQRLQQRKAKANTSLNKHSLLQKALHKLQKDKVPHAD